MIVGVGREGGWEVEGIAPEALLFKIQRGGLNFDDCKEITKTVANPAEKMFDPNMYVPEPQKFLSKVSLNLKILTQLQQHCQMYG